MESKDKGKDVCMDFSKAVSYQRAKNTCHLFLLCGFNNIVLTRA
jgi:hypothetical protein